MKVEGEVIKNEVKDEIKKLEEKNNIKLSTTQKILLTINGPILPILDVLYGKVHLFMIDQHMENAKESYEIIDVEKGDQVLFRESIMHRGGRPLIHMTAAIPTAVCSKETLEELFEEKLTISQIMENHQHETFRKITKISLEKPNSRLEDLFKTSEDIINREYIMIHKGKVVLWAREAYPISHFTIN